MNKREARIEALYIAQWLVSEGINDGVWAEDSIGDPFYPKPDEDKVEKQLKIIADKMLEKYQKMGKRARRASRKPRNYAL